MQVLDHGFVKLLNLAGPTRRPLMLEHESTYGETRAFDADDVDPAQAARMSFDNFGEARTYDEDMKLNHYLLKNGHTSPFEMISVWLEVKVPIFIDRQFVRHRTWKRNESSGRYITLPPEWYIPEIVGGKPTTNAKQGQSDTLSPELQQYFKTHLNDQCRMGYELYTEMIGQGVAPEHARMFLHVNHYVHWLGNVDLSNLYKFLALRAHSHAQIEARKYAAVIIDLLRPHLPGLMQLFDELVRKSD
jgi:thymidylate synthase (FAD)